MGNRKICFTLIELLVIIAIITILITLLFPSINKAKKAAEGSDCRTKLKQIGIAALNYSTDYKEYFPSYYFHYPADEAGKQGGMASYLGFLKTVSRKNTVFTCPTAFKAYPCDYSGWPMNRTYALNRYIQSTDSSNQICTDAITLSKVKIPSAMLMFSDSVQIQQPADRDGKYFHGTNIQTGINSSYLTTNYFFHNSTINTVFIDGHTDKSSIQNISSINTTKAYPFWTGGTEN